MREGGIFHALIAVMAVALIGLGVLAGGTGLRNGLLVGVPLLLVAFAGRARANATEASAATARLPAGYRPYKESPRAIAAAFVAALAAIAVGALVPRWMSAAAVLLVAVSFGAYVFLRERAHRRGVVEDVRSRVAAGDPTARDLVEDLEAAYGEGPMRAVRQALTS